MNEGSSSSSSLPYEVIKEEQRRSGCYIRREAAKTDKTSAGIIVISAVEDILSI